MSLLNYLKENFDHILIFDYEFQQLPGETPDVVCLTVKDLITGKTEQQWLVGNDQKFPFPVSRSLLVGHYVSAEASCYLETETRLPKLWFDTFVEELKFYSGLKNHKFGLIDCCHRYNIETISHVIKDQKRKVVMDNYPNYTGAEKAEILEYNLSDVEINEKVCVDIGASTGGFTEVLLKNNAKHVYCIDVGRGQLDWKLATDKKVTVFDRTNARNVDIAEIDENIEVITCDLSFISIKKGLSKIIEFNKTNISLIVLVKPQFELSKDKIGKNGIVSEPSYRNEAVNEISDWLVTKNWKVHGIIDSCITGTKGNQEYFIYCVKK